MSTVTISGHRRSSTVRRITLADFHGAPSWGFNTAYNVMRDVIVRIDGLEYTVVEGWVSALCDGKVYLKFHNGNAIHIDHRKVYIRKG